MKIIAVYSFVLCAALVAHAQDPYADSVAGYTPGTGINTSFETPAAALGAPASSATITTPAFSNSQIVGVGDGGELTVEFNTPITNDPADHAGGMDFTIFGNEFFTLSGGTLGGIFNHVGLTVWVSQDGMSFYQLVAPGGGAHGADDLFPTAGSGNAALPLGSSLSLSSFTGLTTTQALALYNGSAGGSSYSISWAQDAEGTPVDLPSISYVEIEGSPGFGYVDSIARVEAIPEPSQALLLAAGACVLLFSRWKKPKRKIEN